MICNKKYNFSFISIFQHLHY